MSLKHITTTLTFTLVASTLLLAGCDLESTQDKQAEKRDAIAERANKSVPVPDVNNFQNRQAVAERMRRMDDPDKTFYTYILGRDGSKIGYFVTRTHPISICQMMTPPKMEYDINGTSADPLGPAPTLDGLYAGSADGCDHYYAFTADTDTMIEFSNDFFIADQPLKLPDAPLLAK